MVFIDEAKKACFEILSFLLTTKFMKAQVVSFFIGFLFTKAQTIEFIT